jgi:S1-C subfamily serine protease
VNAFDAFILAMALSAAYGGFRLGFVARAASWVGMAIGLVLAARLVPVVASHTRSLDDADGLLLAAAVLVAGTFLGQAAGLVVGSRLHLALPHGPVRQADKGAGAAAGAVGVLVAVWLLLPAMASIPDWPAREARNSAIARTLSDALPAPPDPLRTLRQLLGNDAFPEVFDGLRPAPALGPPPAETGLSQATAEAVARSTVRVQGPACGRIQDGSGSVVAPDLVATNAHVVAGEQETTVDRYPDGTAFTATVVAFDAERDIAILYVPDLGRPPLPIVAPAVGDVGGVFGHPGGGPLRVAPYGVGDVTQATGTDIYDSHRVERDVLFLSAALMPGDSGSPLVNGAGAVEGVAFAIAPDRPGVSYALSTSELHAVLDPVVAAGLTAPVSTGECIG